MKKLIFVAILFVFISCEDEYVSPCADITCSNHGACRIDENNKLYCSCESGYHSKDLECIKNNPVDPCDGITCSGHGTCEVNNSKTSCSCNSGYHADGLECIKNNPVDPCDGITCSGHGTCEVNNSKASCSCNSGYHADDLECLENGSENTFKIRLMAANTSNGPSQEYRDPGIRVFQAIKPDVVMIQEFNYSTSLRDLVNKAFGQNYNFYSGTGQIPNGVITNYNILESGYWDDPKISNRDLDWAIVDIPGDKDLFVVSVHLHTKPYSHQVIAAQVIAREISKIKEDNPNKYYYVVGGDFNGSSAVSNNGFGQYQGEDIFYVQGPHPRTAAGEYYTNANKYKSKYIDYILASEDLNNMQVPAKFCSPEDKTDCKTYENGLVFNTNDFTQDELDKYFSPTVKNDVNSFQHMAIIKDFEIAY